MGKIKKEHLNPCLRKWLEESSIEIIYFTSFGGGNSAKNLFKKWYRNYFYGASIKYYSAHKSIYFYYVFIILLFLAYNWNGLVAKWNSEDPFYIPNITKFIFFILIGSYLLIRSIVMPLRKGVNISYLFPFNFFLIFIFSLILDFIKFSAFLSARFLKKTFFNFFKFNMN